MILNIIIFLVAIVISFGMLAYRAWEIETSRVAYNSSEKNEFGVPFRKIEKNIFFFTKHIVQHILVFVAKYWFIISIKTKKKYQEAWPKIHDYLLRKKITSREKNLFIKRAVIESKMKIRHIKEKIKRENRVN